MSGAVTIIIGGPPPAKGRPRLTRRGFAYTPTATRKYEAHGRLAAQPAMDGRPPINRRHRRFDRARNGAAVVMTKLQRGAALNLSFERGAPRWVLSDGTPVRDEIAKIVVANHRVINVGDALFKGMPGQTFRYCDD
jgi:hypothetical protein